MSRRLFFRYAKDLYSFVPFLDVLLFSTLNGAWLHGGAKQRAMQVSSEKAQGRKNGVADILCLIPMKGYNGLAIEMKRKSGSTVSDNQKEFLRAVEKVGFFATISYGADEAIDTLNWYLGIQVQ